MSNDYTGNYQSFNTLRLRAARFLGQETESDALFASIGDGALVTDNNGRIYRINDSALEMLGYEREELLGRWFPEAIVAVNDEGKRLHILKRPISQAFLTGRPVSMRTNYLRKDGSKIPVAITVSPFVARGKPHGAIEVFRDISKEREIERMKTEFIYLASHQLRTPLSAIKTYAHLLQDESTITPDDNAKIYINIMLDSIERMNDIISTLLSVSRLEAGKLDPTIQSLNLSTLMAGVVQEMKPLAINKEQKITLVAPALESIETDELLLREILANLLSNAIKYTPEKGTITLSLRKTDDLQVIHIHDNGQGIPTSDQRRLFQKFYRASNANDSKETGTGLGLYLVKGLCEVLGIRIKYKSEVGHGTLFSLAIPIKFGKSHKNTE